MQAHCLQHAPFEGLGAIETWLSSKKFKISYTRFFQKDNLPEVDDIDWLIVMGGPMSVNDEIIYPWLVDEKEFIRKCIEKKKTIIGVCLGSQLIANALGSPIYKNAQKEIGWFPLKKSLHITNPVFNNFPETMYVFHWHGETFDLPKNAQLIAFSEVCLNQVFTLFDHVAAFQCHLETTSESLALMLENCGDEIIPAPYIQTAGEMTEGFEKHAKKMHEVLFRILDEFYKRKK